MGLGGISLWQLLILLLIVVLLFGTKRLRSIGSDLSGAIRDFRKGLSGDDEEHEEAEERLQADGEGSENKSAESASEPEHRR